MIKVMKKMMERVWNVVRMKIKKKVMGRMTMMGRRMKKMIMKMLMLES